MRACLLLAALLAFADYAQAISFTHTPRTYAETPAFFLYLGIGAALFGLFTAAIFARVAVRARQAGHSMRPALLFCAGCLVIAILGVAGTLGLPPFR